MDSGDTRPFQTPTKLFCHHASREGVQTPVRTTAAVASTSKLAAITSPPYSSRKVSTIFTPHSGKKVARPGTPSIDVNTLIPAEGSALFFRNFSNFMRMMDTDLSQSSSENSRSQGVLEDLTNVNHIENSTRKNTKADTDISSTSTLLDEKFASGVTDEHLLLCTKPTRTAPLALDFDVDVDVDVDVDFDVDVGEPVISEVDTKPAASMPSHTKRQVLAMTLAPGEFSLGVSKESCCEGKRKKPKLVFASPARSPLTQRTPKHSSEIIHTSPWNNSSSLRRRENISFCMENKKTKTTVDVSEPKLHAVPKSSPIFKPGSRSLGGRETRANKLRAKATLEKLISSVMPENAWFKNDIVKNSSDVTNTATCSSCDSSGYSDPLQLRTDAGTEDVAANEGETVNTAPNPCFTDVNLVYISGASTLEMPSKQDSVSCSQDGCSIACSSEVGASALTSVWEGTKVVQATETEDHDHDSYNYSNETSMNQSAPAGELIEVDTIIHPVVELRADNTDQMKQVLLERVQWQKRELVNMGYNLTL